MSKCKCPCHQAKDYVTITMSTRVNGGRISNNGTFTVRDGDHLTIEQPVVVDFVPGGPPFRVESPSPAGTRSW